MLIPAFLLIFFLLCGSGILFSLFAPASWRAGIFAWFGAGAAVALVFASASALITGNAFHLLLWSLPGLTTLTLTLDQLSAVFLLITGLVLFPASIFAGSELKIGCPQSFAALLLGLYAAIVLILIAGDALLFLLAWEIMSILCYLLIVDARDNQFDRASAGYLLLAMGEAGTLAAALAFLVLAVASGTLNFAGIKSAAAHFGPTVEWAVFLLSFFGFGVKAGLIPVNFWLPRAYLAAPRAFVPILAGATLNLGLYGILRVNTDLMPATIAGPGLIALAVGTLSALVGILYATTDNDLRMMLAHSSIENVGIIVAGLGAGMVFIATDHPVPAAIAFAAALYHLMNHSLYKTLLFFGVETVHRRAGSRDMDRLGGLIKFMPLTALGFLVGALSIAALPPFNGFVSEWLTLQTMLRSSVLSSTAIKIVFALCGAGLALTAALAVTCFVKVFAMTFLGMQRSENMNSTEAGAGALAPMAILAVLCLLFGILPTYIIPLLNSALNSLTGSSVADALVPAFFSSSPAHAALPPAFVSDFHNIGAQVGQSALPGRGLVVMHRGGAANPVVFAMSTTYMLAVLVILLALTFVIIRLGFTRARRLSRRQRWDGGIRRLLPEMTYTATGFSNPVRVIFDAVFRPTTVEDTRQTVEEHFRTAIRREKQREHLVDKLIFHPVETVVMWCSRTLSFMHHGRFNAYAAYALLTLLVVLVVFLFSQTP